MNPSTIIRAALPFLRLTVACALVVLPHLAPAAELTLKNGSSYQDSRVIAFTRDAQGAGVLNVRLLEPSGDYSQEYALPIDQIQSLSFQADEPLGTQGDIIVTGGLKYPPMQVLGGENHPTHGFAFHVVDEKTSPQDPLKVPASQLASITFPHQTPSSSSIYGSSSSDYNSSSRYSDDDDEDDNRGSASYRGSFDDDEMPAISSGGLMMFAGIGLAIIGLALLIYVVINTLVNSVIILFVCKLGSVPEIRYKQCFFCAVYLSILPVILFPLALIPFIGFWAYLVCLFMGGPSHRHGFPRSSGRHRLRHHSWFRCQQLAAWTLHQRIRRRGWRITTHLPFFAIMSHYVHHVHTVHNVHTGPISAKIPAPHPGNCRLACQARFYRAPH